MYVEDKKKVAKIIRLILDQADEVDNPDYLLRIFHVWMNLQAAMFELFLEIQAAKMDGEKLTKIIQENKS